MSDWQTLIAEAQQVAAQTKDTTLVSDCFRLLRPARVFPKTQYEAVDPIKKIRAQWKELADVIEADLAKLKKNYDKRLRNLTAQRDKVATRITARGGLRQAATGGTATGLVDIAAIAGAAIDEKSLEIFDTEIALLEGLHGNTPRRLRFAMWRIRFLRFCSLSFRAFLNLALYLVVLRVSLWIDPNLERFADELVAGDLGAFGILALILLIIEWLKGLAYQERFDRWLRGLEHRKTANELVTLCKIAAQLRIQIARNNWYGLVPAPTPAPTPAPP